jgi:hypothetical protein
MRVLTCPKDQVHGVIMSRGILEGTRKKRTMIKFIPETHKYISLDPNDTAPWTSVTTMLSAFKHPFDGKAVAESVSMKPGSKWFNMDPVEIQDIWKKESQRAIDLGNFYHDREEAFLFANKTLFIHGEELPVIRYIVDENGRKTASDQRLIPGIYPEHMLYLKPMRLVGQSDRLEVAKGQVHIGDYKTNKKIETSSFVDWQGNSKKMLGPVSHLDDCNFNHYNLQLSMYMYMALRHNPRLRPGTITVYHIEFEQQGEDKYGYPIEARDENGDPIVKKVNNIPMPYLEREISDILEYIRQNPLAVTKKVA